MEIDFYYDIVCPFAALASLRVARIAALAPVRVRYRPLLLGGLLRSLGVPPDPNASMPASKALLVRKDALRQAAWQSAPLVWPAVHPRKTLLAMRLLAAADEEVLPSLTAALMHAAWFDPAAPDLQTREVVSAIARRHDLSIDLLDAPWVKEKLRQSTEEARARGVFGVPTVAQGDRLWFGVDRLSALEQSLGVPCGACAPEIVRPPEAGHQPVIEWFHDVASPFSYLSSVSIEAMCASLGARLVARPILVGALFREIGTPLVPIHTFSEAKAAWLRAEMANTARTLGVPFVFPSRFPLRSLHAARILCLEPRAAGVLYGAAWARDRDISAPEVLLAELSGAGFDGPALISAAEIEQTKEILRSNTARAVSVGVCGVPSFLVDRSELFWGQDRMEQVAHAAAGWRLASPS